MEVSIPWISRTFHAGRRFAEVKSGSIAYYERGDRTRCAFHPRRPAQWLPLAPRDRPRMRHDRRCIAIDLMGLGYSRDRTEPGCIVHGAGTMTVEVLDALGIDKVDLVANDSGGAIAQIFAAKNPARLSSLVLTNCDVHDNWPPPQVLPLIERARNNTLVAGLLRARRLIAPISRVHALPTGELVSVVSQLCRPKRTDRRGHPSFISKPHPIEPGTDRCVSALLARLRQQAHGCYP